MRALGNYVIIDELGRGGMGIVYRSRARDGRAVAVKLLPKLMADKEATDRFGREMRLLSSLGEEQGFVPLLDSGSSPSGPFFVMPFLEGGTLRRRMDGGPLAVADAVALGVALGHALGAAHRLGIVHRDLKPENILHTADGRPLVSDLGLAKHFAHDATGMSISLSKTGELQGTVGYMAPEQVGDAKSAGPAADVFALGVMLYECLAGERPFEGENPHATLAFTVAGKFTPLSRRRRDVPPAVAAVVERALAHDPEARYEDGAAFALALAASTRTPPRTRRFPALVVGLLALASAGGVALALSLARRTETPRVPPPPPPPPEPPPPIVPTARDFPAACKGFLVSSRMKLTTILGSYRGRHGAQVAALQLSPRGDVLASAGTDRRIVLWTLDGDEVRELAASEPLTSLAFAPDGKTLVAGDVRGAVEVFSGESWTRAPDILVARNAPVIGVSVSDDGKLVAAATVGGSWRTLALDGGGVVADGPPAVRYIHVGFRPGKDQLVVGGGDGLVVLSDASLRVPRAIHNLLKTEELTTCAVSGDGSRAVAGDVGGAITVWDFDHEDPLRKTHVLRGGGGVTCVAVSRNGGLGLAGGADGVAHVLDLATGSLVASLEGCEGAARSAAFSSDGRRVFVGADDGRVHGWELGKRGEPPRRLWADGGHFREASTVAVASGGRLISGNMTYATCRIWDTKHETEIGRLTGKPSQGDLNGIAVSPDQRTVVTVAHDQAARFFELETRNEFWTVGGYANNVLAAAFSRDGRVVTGDDGGMVRILDPVKRTDLRATAQGSSWIRSVAWIPGDDRVAICGHDGSLRVLSAADGSTIFRLDGVEHSGRVAALAQGKVLWSWGDGTVHVVDVDGRRDLGPFRAHEKNEPRLLVFPGGKRLATVAPGDAARRDDPTVRLLDLESKTELDRVSLASAHDVPLSLAVTEDGRTLYVGTVRGVVLGFSVER